MLGVVDQQCCVCLHVALWEVATQELNHKGASAEKSSRHIYFLEKD